jgi:hypothetical protein
VFEQERRLNERDLLIWNSFNSKLRWRDFATPRWEELERKCGISNRSDTLTMSDLIDFDEGRLLEAIARYLARGSSGARKSQLRPMYSNAMWFPIRHH